VGNVESYVSERSENLHPTKSGPEAGTTRESKWHYFTTMSFVDAVMIPRRTISNVPAAEESILANTPSLEDINASTNVSINDNDKDESSEGVSAEGQVKKSRDKKKDKLSRRSFTFGEMEV